MTDLEQRLVDLETRLAFQEQALLELSDALAAARSEEAGNAGAEGVLVRNMLVNSAELVQRSLDLGIRQIGT